VGAEQKVAVITGAPQDIGAALVKAYLDHNYRVVATARSVQSTSNADILVIPGDIADRKTAERAISEGLGRFGRIDTLVNNAGAANYFSAASRMATSCSTLPPLTPTPPTT
jgi:NAD(P)-dependent dehydrogenase (short-subunit alcohol dehydrogenase family)